MAITFVNYKVTVVTRDYYKKTQTRRVSFGKNISYFVYNRCYHNAAVVRMLISPDRKVWMEDGLEIEVGPRELVTLAPNYFSKYMALEYKSKRHCHQAELDIWFQMTRPPAKQCYGVGNDWV